VHGSCDVLDPLLAEIEGEVEAVAHLLVYRGAEANPARLSQRFEPGGNIDAVAEDVAILDVDVAEIDAHAKFDAALWRCCGVAGDHLALHLDRTAPYWRLTKSKLPEANGNAALSPCTQATSGIFRRARRNILASRLNRRIWRSAFDPGWRSAGCRCRAHYRFHR
jgi:hypothetical protein